MGHRVSLLLPGRLSTVSGATGPGGSPKLVFTIFITGIAGIAGFLPASKHSDTAACTHCSWLIEKEKKQLEKLHHQLDGI